MLDLTCLLPDPSHLVVCGLTVDPEPFRCVVTIAATQTQAICPLCGHPAQRIHSRYHRTIADLPWAGIPVQLVLQVRRWFCDHVGCHRQIFTERLPHIVAPYQRRTHRLATAQQRIGLALGGAAGARLAADLAMPAGIDLLLTLVRQTAITPPEAAPHIGIDDWALRKGHRYGSVIINLDTHRPITLLDDRSADQVAAWLSNHPEVRVVSRDRGQVYIDGATRGAPDAIQVADRWHLLKNLGDALLPVIQTHLRAIHAALPVTLAPTPSAQPSAAEPPVPIATEPLVPRPPRPADQRRSERHQAIHQLHQQGWSQRAIAQHLHLERKTVRTYLRMGATVTGRQRPDRHSCLDPFKPYLLERWNAGCRNAMQLLREIQGQGFLGQRSVVRSFLTELRKAQGLPPRSRNATIGKTTSDPTARPPSARKLTWMVLKRQGKLDADERITVDILTTVHPDLTHAITLAQQFAQIVRERDEASFSAWMQQASTSGLRSFRGFVTGLRQDEAAVRAALSLPWSQGPVEGNINRLKLLKRQMYGRAKLDLLQQRFLAR